MTILAEAIDRYHENLSNRVLAVDSAERMTSMLRKEGLFFGDRPLCNVLRPRFLTPYGANASGTAGTFPHRFSPCQSADDAAA